MSLITQEQGRIGTQPYRGSTFLTCHRQFKAQLVVAQDALPDASEAVSTSTLFDKRSALMADWAKFLGA